MITEIVEQHVKAHGAKEEGRELLSELKTVGSETSSQLVLKHEHNNNVGA